MSERLDEKTKSALIRYLTDIRSLPNESAKTHRFSAVIGELFPGTSASTDFAAGVEKIIRIDTTAGKKTGRIDSYYGNAVIEFENSLKATAKEAERQLRAYVSGVWAKEGTPTRPLIAIASDGLSWKIYRPNLVSKTKGKPKAEDIGLEELREITLSEKTLADFWVWLTSLLFRPERTIPTANQFRVDFGAASPAFRDGIEALGRAWDAVRKQSEPRLAFETWQKYLTVTYGRLTEAPSENEDEALKEREGITASDLEVLFLKHTYLASVARLLIWASLSRGKSKGAFREVAMEVLSGQFFESQGLANLVEDDFFQWVRRPRAEGILAPVWERIIASILTYDLAHLNEDVLKGVYQELVDPKDRHDLGEYYTPDWLCERIVSEILPKKGFVSVLDPTCGSGSFLRAAITHLLHANPNGSDSVRLQSILDHIVGIDIHPLAVLIARTTYLLALGQLIKSSRRPIQIPVYLADSLFLPAEVKQYRLGEKTGYDIKFGGDRAVIISEKLVESPDLFDPAIAACTKIASDHASSGRESIKTLRTYLARSLPPLADRDDYDDVVGALWQFTDHLSDLIRKGKNSIWAFIVRNAYRPAMLRERFDFVIGNPPWLSYRYIADLEYQAEVKERAVVQYGIAPASQKLMTQMELATVFLAHCVTTFGRKGSVISFVMPRSIISADQHANLRTRSYVAPFRLTEYWDLLGVRPLFNVPSCVIFARRDTSIGKLSDKLDVKEWEGRLPARDVPWETAKHHLSLEAKSGRVIFLGDRTAFATTPGRTQPNDPSPYAGRFRQGATILPRSFYFVRVKDLEGALDPERLYWAETDIDQAEDAKPPYDDIRMSGHVEGRFLYCTALSRHLVPFAMLQPSVIVAPVERRGEGLRILTAETLKKEGYREFARWMGKAEEIWNKKRQSKAEKQTLYERLDYQKELTVQTLHDRYLVLYNAVGTNLSATSVDRQSLHLPFLVEHKLYWASFSTQEEVDYLASILNSEVTNQAIKPFQSMGLMGERDIEKKVLDLPLPEYKQSLAKHRDLARLGAEARNVVEELLSSSQLSSSVAKRRALVRNQIHDITKEIDAIVKSLI